MAEGVVYNVYLTPKASAQARKAAAYYGDISKALKVGFSNELEDKLRLLESFQGQAVVFDNVQATFLRRFPYVVYFKVDTRRGQIEIINILHQRQNRP